MVRKIFNTTGVEPEVDKKPELQEIQKAYETIRDKIFMTPVVLHENFNVSNNNKVFLKLENLQKTGAFKIRGVINKISSLSIKEKENGLICATSGNHGFGVAYVCNMEGIKALVVVPENTPESKVQHLKRFADVEVRGKTYLESFYYAREIGKEKKMTFIHGFDDPYIIAGQGTIAIEIIQQIPDIDCIIAPIGGGGLVAGILTYVKNVKPGIKVIGVQAQGAGSMYWSWKKGRIIELERINTIAEGIAVKKPGELTFSIVQRYVDDIVLVSDEEIKNGVQFLFDEFKIVSEFAGAVAISAILAGKIKIQSKKIVCIVSGGNISLKELAKNLS
ncbi:MAG: pyridoxal-phosphate dependent enzyme [bacterium]|nr:pyridoxal-phosphate dependent enzyme [bacterium]